MKSLAGKVAVVTGASRGVGKGIAAGLGEAGATVYVTGRTTREQPGAMPGSIEETAEEVSRRGGLGIPVRCDHRNDDEVAALFERVRTEQGRLDVLVNNVWGGYERMIEDGEWTWERPFWEQPLWRWDAMFQAGVRAHLVASQHAAPMMIAQHSGLIVNISFWSARKRLGNAIYGMAKAATDTFTRDAAIELHPHGVACVSLYPGLVRTESVMESAAWLDLSNSESPVFVGRAVAALAGDGEVLRHSGTVLLTAQLGLDYGFTDEDGTQVRPITLDEA